MKGETQPLCDGHKNHLPVESGYDLNINIPASPLVVLLMRFFLFVFAAAVLPVMFKVDYRRGGIFVRGFSINASLFSTYQLGF